MFEKYQIFRPYEYKYLKYISKSVNFISRISKQKRETINSIVYSSRLGFYFACKHCIMWLENNSYSIELQLQYFYSSLIYQDVPKQNERFSLTVSVIVNEISKGLGL